MIESEQIEVAYLSGLFDGEGCIRIAPRPLKSGRINHSLELILTNTYLPTLLDLREKWGGYLRIQYRRGIKPLGHLRWRSHQAADLLSLMEPFLRIKAEQCRVAKAFLSLLNPAPYRGKKLSEENIKSRGVLMKKLSDLKNYKPQGNEDA